MQWKGKVTKMEREHKDKVKTSVNLKEEKKLNDKKKIDVNSKKDKKKNEDSPKVRNIKFNILAIVAIVLFSAVLAPITFQNDTFYTIKIGEHILQTGTVDMQDPFSWHEGLPYTYPHWLYDIMIYLFYNIGGFTGIFISTVVLSSILGVVIYITNNKISKNNLISFVITLGTMYMMKDYIAARAQLVTFILFELGILCMENFLDSKKIRYGIGILVIGILIANIHAAVWPFMYVLFLPYLAEYILNFDYMKLYYKIKDKYYNFRIDKYKNSKKADEKTSDKIDKLNNKLSESKLQEVKQLANREKRRKNPYKIRMKKIPAVKWLILIMIIYAFTGLLTPIGDTPYTWTYNTMRGNTTESINEHLPLTLIDEKTLMVIIAFIIAILVFTDVKIRLKDLFMIGGLTVLMFISRRQTSMFFLFGSGVLAKLIADLIAKYDKDGTEEFKKIMVSTLGTIATLLIIALLMIIQIKGKVDDKYVNTKSYPVDAANYIKENLDLSSIHLFNEYNYGSYLLFEGIPVFIDSRADLYTPEFNKTAEYPEGRDIFSDYMKTSSIARYYENTFDEYDITHIILYKNSKLSMLLSKDSEGYTRLYTDDNFVIYQRNNK